MKFNSLRKRFIAVEGDLLVIETIQTLEGDTLTGAPTRLRILKLKGTWRANEENELCFDVALHKGATETYTFKGAWKINQNQQIEYSSGDGPDILTFKGFWDISSANRLVYALEGSSSSRFEFKVQLESPSFYPKEGQIRYRIGIGVRENRLTVPDQVIILYGEWKFSRTLGLVFEMEYLRGVIQALKFAAELDFTKNDQISFNLTVKEGEPLGFNVVFTHDFIKQHDAQAFVRLKKIREEYAVDLGIRKTF